MRGDILLPVLVGIVLRANGTWFNGAYALGTVCLVVGLWIAAVELVRSVTRHHR